MSKASDRPAGLRVVAREAIRIEVAARAIDLFRRKGYDETTVDDICSSAGISPRSFFRYFASKEEVVLGDVLESGEALTSAVRSRPGAEDVWTSMRHGVRALLDVEMSGEAERFLNAMTVVCESPALRAGYLQKHLAWAQMVCPVLVERAGEGRPGSSFTARTVVHVAFACLDSALVEWVEQPGRRSLSELLDEAFAVPSPVVRPDGVRSRRV